MKKNLAKHSTCVLVDLAMFKIEFQFSDIPYIPGLLAFREAKPIVDLVEKQRKSAPESSPDYLMLDGNGLLHPRKCGLACHIGVLLDCPTIGVAKQYFALDSYFDDEMTPKDARSAKKNEWKNALVNAGDCQEILFPDDNSLVGLVLKTSKSSSRPVFVSVGHKVSLAEAKAVTLRTCIYKIPEPTRMADMIGRDFVRKNC